MLEAEAFPEPLEAAVPELPAALFPDSDLDCWLLDPCPAEDRFSFLCCWPPCCFRVDGVRNRPVPAPFRPSLLLVLPSLSRPEAETEDAEDADTEADTSVADDSTVWPLTSPRPCPT